MLRVYTTRDGLGGNSVRDIAEDAGGRLWIGTNAGLNKLENGRLTRLTMRDGLSHDSIRTLHFDRAGNLWIGTIGGGLDCLRDGVFTHYTTAQGMPSDGVRSIYEDADGTLWFATVSGAAVVNPRMPGVAPQPPPVVIESMVVDDETVKDAVGLELAPESQRIEFHYTGLSFAAPERVRFRYRLEGFDHDWVEAGTRRTAYYTNLPPGRYRFHVTAANADGVWSTEGANVEFGLRPHFYQTGWFYALCTALSLALALGLYLLRVRRMRRQFALVLAERTRVAREMHDTLIQGVVGASAVLEAVSGMLPRTTSPAYGYLERAREQLRHSLDDARRAVWDLRNPSAQAQDLTTALRRTVERLAADTPAEIEMEQTGRARRLDGACEESLLRVAQEAVANAVTHAGARRIKVRLHFAARSVRLSVGDDGRGFDASQSLAFNGDNHHFGLAGMHERAAACGGHLTVESVPGSGTTIIATLPV